MKSVAESEVVPNVELSATQISKLLFLSFKFSQGDDVLQKDIKKYAHFVHPEWKISDRVELEVAQLGSNIAKLVSDQVEPKIGQENVIVVHKHVSGNIEKIWSNELQKMRKIFNSEVNSADDNIKNTLRRILKGITDRDHNYCISTSRFRSGKTNAEYNPIMDEHLSHLVYYGMLGNPTGEPVYDNMFEDVNKLLPNYLKSRSMFGRFRASRINRIKEAHNRYHPDMEV